MCLKERVIAGVRVETVGLILCQGSQEGSAVSTQQSNQFKFREVGGEEKHKNTLISRGLQRKHCT